MKTLRRSRLSRLSSSCIAIVICLAQAIIAVPRPVLAAPTAREAATDAIVIEITADGLSPATMAVQQGATVVWRNQTDQSFTLVEGAPTQLYLPMVTSGEATAQAAMVAPEKPILRSPEPKDDFGGVVPAKGELRQTFDALGTHRYYVDGLLKGVGVLNVLSTPVELLQVTPDTDPGAGFQAVIEKIADPHSNRDGMVNFAFDLKNISGQNLAIRALHFTYMDAGNNVLKKQSVSPDQMVDLLMSLNLDSPPNPDNWSFAGGKAALVNRSWDNFYANWHDLEGQGWRMTDIEVKVDDGKVRFSGLFAPGSYSPAALVGLEWGDFLSGWQDLEGKGYRIFDIETYVSGNKRLYAGLFKPANYAKAALVNMEWSPFLTSWQDLEAQGMRMIDIEVHESGGKVLYTGSVCTGFLQPGRAGRQGVERLLRWLAGLGRQGVPHL